MRKIKWFLRICLGIIFEILRPNLDKITTLEHFNSSLNIHAVCLLVDPIVLGTQFCFTTMIVEMFELDLIDLLLNKYYVCLFLPQFNSCPEKRSFL